MKLIAMFHAPPLLALALSLQVNYVRALLDAGAQVDEADKDRITSLAWSAIGNRLEMARLLIARGAVSRVTVRYGWIPASTPSFWNRRRSVT